MSHKVEPINPQDAISLAITPFESLKYLLDNIPGDQSDPNLGRHVAILLGLCAEKAEHLLIDYVVPQSEG